MIFSERKYFKYLEDKINSVKHLKKIKNGSAENKENNLLKESNEVFYSLL